MTRHNFVVGDRVIFVDNFPGYGLGANNPLLGTEWECVGTVSQGSDYEYVSVRWDNGCTNSYDKRCLRKTAGSSDPNHLFAVAKKKRSFSKPEGLITRGRKCRECGYVRSEPGTMCNECGAIGRWVYRYKCLACSALVEIMPADSERIGPCICGAESWHRII